MSHLITLTEEQLLELNYLSICHFKFDENVANLYLLGIFTLNGIFITADTEWTHAVINGNQLIVHISETSVI